ncbi:MAG TPA: hypothetical protein VJG32_02170 [Anaerolineae bacterium]|nr:hypothetical protein [Anaerolineae bacterium]
MKISIAHGHRPTREVLARALASQLQAEVTPFSSVENVLVSSLDYDIFVVYNNFERNMDGITGVSKIREQKPHAFIIGVSYKPYYEKKFLPAGADAFLLRAGNEIEELVRIIQTHPKSHAADDRRRSATAPEERP